MRPSCCRANARAARWACVPSTSGSRSSAGLRATVENVEYLGADSLVACRIGGQPLHARVAGRCGLARGETTWLEWAPGAQHLVRCGRHARRRRHATRGDAIRVAAITIRFSRGGDSMVMHGIKRWISALTATLRIGGRNRRGSRSDGRSAVLLSGRCRRADHQDHRRLRRGLREGESRHQAEADLLRQLPGVDREGAHRRQER